MKIEFVKASSDLNAIDPSLPKIYKQMVESKETVGAVTRGEILTNEEWRSCQQYIKYREPLV